MSDSTKIFHDDPEDDPAPRPDSKEDHGVTGMIERAFDSFARSVEKSEHSDDVRSAEDQSER